MTRKPRVQRTPEEMWEVVLEGLQSGNCSAPRPFLLRSETTLNSPLGPRSSPQLRFGTRKNHASSL
jgi:hypothetical protein